MTPAATAQAPDELFRYSGEGVPGLTIKRYWTTEGIHPYDQLDWEFRDATIGNEKGETVFEQKNVEVPKSWSQLAVNVVVSKYFRGHLDTPLRETSIRQLIDRVTNTIVEWGDAQHYFASDEDAAIYRDELVHLLVNQKMAFNSPVWFNVGIEAHPQCSACFINSVTDDMGSIMDLAKTEAMLFKYGSGSGVNLSTLRGSGERLSVGGHASGPVSFMKGLDAFAGVVKSGGKTRRSAKMVILDAGHPDVMTFIDSKLNEEKKAWALIEQGYDGAFTGEAYGSIFFQNANHSVRVNDQFMSAYERDGDWTTHGVRDGQAMETYKARDIMRKMAEAAHQCGDPGIQYDDIINDWHTCKTTDRIYASNPCSEYMFLNDTACNLASLNLMKFLDAEGNFDQVAFTNAARLTIIAQEILVDNASYPTPLIEKNSHDFRPLGLGYANLGALLMHYGLPYDSSKGRELAAVITSMMTGTAYATSAEIARDHGGPFPGYYANELDMLDVMEKHKAAADKLSAPDGSGWFLAVDSWDEAIDLGGKYGFRNAQATVLAPTGTIAFMMDCDTTGVEPDIALIKYKKLVGDGYLKIVNKTVPSALERLGGYHNVDAIVAYIAEHETIEGAPGLRAEDLPVFDCAFKPVNGSRSIAPMGHVKMMAAVQPFISGAISKTVNLPEAATVEEIENVYIEGWKLGLKAIAVYRDGSKRSQPMNAGKSKDPEVQVKEVIKYVNTEKRRKLPNERQAITHKFSIAGHEGYLTVGLYEDGAPGEIFLRMSKEGSTLSGLMDSFATAVSLGLQYGVSLEDFVNKFSHSRFEPSGFTGNAEVPIAKSIVDYVFRWMAARFLSAEVSIAVGNQAPLDLDLPPVTLEVEEVAPEPPIALAAFSSNGNGHAKENPVTDAGYGLMTFENSQDAPPCTDCGSITVRNGSCYKCLNCGSTTGCS